MMETLAEAKAAVVEEFALMDEWMDKYEFLIELGKNLEPFPVKQKTEDKLIKGCQSRVWLDTELRDGRLWFRADSDAIITRGIIAMLVGVYNGRTAAEIAGDDFGFVEEIGLKENLSPTRANGLAAMIDRIRKEAQEYA